MRPGAAPGGCVRSADVDAGANDRVAKPAQYAAAGIAHFWRIEPDPPVLVRYLVSDGVYREVGRSGGVVELQEPVPASVDVGRALRLIAARAPA